MVKLPLTHGRKGLVNPANKSAGARARASRFLPLELRIKRTLEPVPITASDVRGWFEAVLTDGANLKRTQAAWAPLAERLNREHGPQVPFNPNLLADKREDLRRRVRDLASQTLAAIEDYAQYYNRYDAQDAAVLAPYKAAAEALENIGGIAWVPPPEKETRGRKPLGKGHGATAELDWRPAGRKFAAWVAAALCDAGVPGKFDTLTDENNPAVAIATEMVIRVFGFNPGALKPAGFVSGMRHRDRRKDTTFAARFPDVARLKK